MTQNPSLVTVWRFESPSRHQVSISQHLIKSQKPHIWRYACADVAWDHLQSVARVAEVEGKPVSDKIALVLNDLEMPEMNGFTLTRNIKQDTRFRGIPVVIYSSLTGNANEDHVRNVGADAYVAKFVAEELAATMRKVLTQL